MARITYRTVNGIVLLDKPAGVSSNKALQIVRRMFRAAKGGHTGSLDPLATGLLPLCFGEATKIAGLLLGSRKAYEADCRLGQATTTDDAEGEVLEQRPVPALDRQTVDEALNAFTGHIEQVPPIYSALKRDGVPMYKRARAGEQLDLPSRAVHIEAIEILALDGTHVRLRVTCGSGTYIRALARDLGDKLGCGAHLTGLRRLWVDPFTHPEMLTMAELEARARQGDEALASCLLPVDAGLARMPALRLDVAQSRALGFGQSVVCAGAVPGVHRAYAADGQLLALTDVAADGRLRVRRGFNLPSAQCGLSG